MSDERVWTLCANKRRGLEGAPMVIDGPRLSLYENLEVVPADLLRGAVEACEARVQDAADESYKLGFQAGKSAARTETR